MIIEPSSFKIFWQVFNLIVIFGLLIYIFYVPYVLKKILLKIEELEKFIKEN